MGIRESEKGRYQHTIGERKGPPNEMCENKEGGKGGKGADITRTAFSPPGGRRPSTRINRSCRVILRALCRAVSQSEQKLPHAGWRQNTTATRGAALPSHAWPSQRNRPAASVGGGDGGGFGGAVVGTASGSDVVDVKVEMGAVRVGVGTGARMGAGEVTAMEAGVVALA